MTGDTGTDTGTGAAPTAPVDPDYPVEPVPRHARKSLFSLAVVLVGFTLFTPTMIAGAQVGTGFAFWPLMGVLAAGSALLGLYVGVIGWIGARHSLTTVMMSRYAFGRGGAKLASVLLGGTQVGWYGVSVATLALLTAQAFGWRDPAVVAVLMVVGGVVMGATAYIGYQGMYWLSVVSVPLLLVLAGWVTVRAVSEAGGPSGLAAIEPSASMPVTAAITIIVGTFASGGTQAPNWTRFARTPAAGFWACLLAFLAGQFLMLFCGAIGALAFGEGDFVLVLYQLGLVVWGLVFLVANIWTTNDSTAYNFGVAGAEIFDARTKKPFVVAGVAAGTLLAVTGIYDHLLDYLTWLGVLIPPLGGVLIGDFLGRWRSGLPESSALPAVRWENLAVYALACAAAWWSNSTGFFIAPLVGIAVAVAGTLAVEAVRRGRRTPEPAGR